MRWDLVHAIRGRLDRPYSIPGKDCFTVYREDIRTLLDLIEDLERERREQEDRYYGRGK